MVLRAGPFPRVAPVLLAAAVVACSGGGGNGPSPVIRCDVAPPPTCDAAADLGCLDPCRARDDVVALSAPAMQGRGTGTASNEAAAARIAERFAALGLSPAPGLGGWIQEFSVSGAPRPVPNVLGVLPGTDPDLEAEVVVVGAHLDHLGMQSGVVYPGADDDASGVAVMLELARSFVESATPPRRTLLFAAWNAEELGLLGSCHYAEHAPAFPLADTVAAFSVDMVGQGDESGLVLLGTAVDPTPAIGPVMRGAAASAGLPLDVVSPGANEGSDHVCFSYAGVPAAAAITPGPHYGYHTPADTVALIGTENLRASLELLFVTVQAYAQGEEGAWTPAALRRAPQVAPPEARVVRGVER